MPVSDETYLLISSETYLGDGLYVHFDGWQFLLRAPREGGDHWVALDPYTLRAFDQFRKCAEKALKAEDNGPA